MKRRDLLRAAAGLGGAALGLNPELTEDAIRKLLGAVALESTAQADAAGLSNLGPATLPALHERIRGVAVAYVSEPPLACFAEMVDIRDTIATLLQGQQRPAQRADLHLLAGQVFCLLAGVSVDFADTRGAMNHAIAAYASGEAIGHPELIAWALAMRSRAARYDGRLKDALAFARDGQRHVDRGYVLARLYELEARALSELGDAAAVRAVEQAADVAYPAGLDISDGIGGEFEMSQAWAAYGAATVHLGLGDPMAAVRETERSLQLYAARQTPSNTNITLGRINLAVARVQQGEVDGAQEALAPVLAMPSGMYLKLYDGRLANVSTLLRGTTPQGPQALQLAEQIEDFRQRPRALTAG